MLFVLKVARTLHASNAVHTMQGCCAVCCSQHLPTLKLLGMAAGKSQ